MVIELTTPVAKESFDVDLMVARLYQTRVVRQTLAKVVKPLERDGVDVLATGRDGRTETVVTKDQRVWFEMAASEADVVSDTLRPLAAGFGLIQRGSTAAR